MTPYLRTHKPARSQFRSPRRQRPTGLVVLHTAESVMDAVGPDTGAEAVAAFIRRRTDPGSYHDIADSDSNLLLVGYGDEAYQDGTGSNPFALSISFALKAADWSRLSSVKRAAFLHQGAVAFARQQKWLAAHGYPLTPLRRVTKAQSDRGEAGFIAHGTRDPGRRTDPGADFPWTEWFDACRTVTGQPTPMPPPLPVQEDKVYLVTRNPMPDASPNDWGTDGTSKFEFETQEAKNGWVEVFGAKRKDLPLEVFDAIPTVERAL